MRTTLDIEKPVLDELKKLQKSEKKSLSQLATTLLAEALQAKRHPCGAPSENGLVWETFPMGAKLDLADKDAVYRALDAS